MSSTVQCLHKTIFLWKSILSYLLLQSRWYIRNVSAHLMTTVNRPPFATLYYSVEYVCVWNQNNLRGSNKKGSERMENLQRPHWLNMQCHSKSLYLFCHCEWCVRELMSVGWSLGVCRDMMNANGFAIYANLMLTMYYSRPLAMCTYGIGTKNGQTQKRMSVCVCVRVEDTKLENSNALVHVWQWGVKCWKSSVG